MQNFTVTYQFSTHHNFRVVRSAIKHCNKSGLSVSCICCFIECDQASAKCLEPNLSPDDY